MKIAIIGAGFTGLSAAYELTKKGHKVYVYEKDSQPGGLAIGYKEKEWNWDLEKHYHHWFTNDKSILSLAKEINYEVIIKRPKTSVFIDKNIYQFDSPKEVLLFPKLPIIDRVRMGFVIAIIKFNPFWKPLEKINASKFLPLAIGAKAYRMIWEPLFVNKFGAFSDNISLAWFWARITKRTPSLAYPKGGFLNFANYLVKTITKNGGIFYFTTEVIKVTKEKNITFKDSSGKINTDSFDKIIFTLPSSLFIKTVPDFSDKYKNKFAKLNSLGATNLVLRLRKPFFKDHTYWLSVCDLKSPVMAIVEHTNFMDKKYYNNEHIVYLGNYLSKDSERFKLNKDDILKLMDPYLKLINNDYKENLIGYELFKAPFAQPIIPVNYSKLIPETETEFKDIYLANIEQVYPWDRGTNYAVELGIKVAKKIC